MELMIKFWRNCWTISSIFFGQFLVFEVANSQFADLSWVRMHVSTFYFRRLANSRGRRMSLVYPGVTDLFWQVLGNRRVRIRTLQLRKFLEIRRSTAVRRFDISGCCRIIRQRSTADSCISSCNRRPSKWHHLRSRHYESYLTIAGSVGVSTFGEYI